MPQQGIAILPDQLVEVALGLKEGEGVEVSEGVELERVVAHPAR